MIKTLHKMGIKSNHMYLAGIASIGLSFASWFASKNAEPGAGLDRADRWGIFVGEWAPTFFAMGVALRIEETHREIEESGMEGYGQSQSMRSRSHAGV
ncbi:hypothetical protein MF672_028290 [Actinomadura sp. ATCC 31491]|uniref:DUF2637 domain-containing protein n=1 Tax=Actinomadura luzonensis TaxID=2805427 RepID=A0ABT0G0J9_9ACTN|nr:hypothetical protein [Actinomadura luzonensis]MCK2217663.1 hypothetical protein [Actinomadura luzonensis]